MSTDELARLAAELDDVEIVHNTPEVAGAGHPRRAARRARGRGCGSSSRRSSALAFLVCYLFWPFEYVAPGQARLLACTPSTRR